MRTNLQRYVWWGTILPWLPVRRGLPASVYHQRSAEGVRAGGGPVEKLLHGSIIQTAGWPKKATLCKLSRLRMRWTIVPTYWVRSPSVKEPARHEQGTALY